MRIKLRIKSLVYFHLIMLFGIIHCATSQVQHQILVSQIQNKLDSLKNISGFPGATFAIVLDDGTLLSFATGVSDIENNISMKPSDRMFSGSAGKTFVASIIMQLCDNKKLDLDDKVSDYIGDKEWFHRIPNHKELTIRMLMNHTSGLERYEFKPEFTAELIKTPDKVWIPEELLAFIFDDEPLFKAGEGWAYSDTDYIIIGMIIEKLCNNSYYNELKNRILNPFGLKNTSPSNKRILEGLIPGYTGDGEPPFNLPGKVLVDGEYPINPQFEWTGGGLITTSNDFALWAKNLYEGKVFSEEKLKEMLSAVNYRTGKPDETGY